MASYKMHWTLPWWPKVLIGNPFCLLSPDLPENEATFAVTSGGIADAKEWCFVMNTNKWTFGLIYYLIATTEGFCWQ